MHIYNVNVDFNVQADTQREAAEKMAAYLRLHFNTGHYEAIGEPALQRNVTADDCETLVT